MLESKRYPIPKIELGPHHRTLLDRYPFVFQLPYTGIFDSAVQFCRTTFDAHTYTYAGTVFFFRNERDHILFSLKWG